MTVLSDTADCSAPVSNPAGRFIVLGRDHWQRLWKIPSVNRLNLIAAFLVLLAGTNSSHRITSWSAAACERYAGIGVPRARVAIRELIQGKLVAIASGARAERIRYRLAERVTAEPPIFLPATLVMAFYQDEPSLLKQARETGDEMVLRMLIDLHGMVQPDVTFGMALADLRQGETVPGRVVKTDGENTVWQLSRSTDLMAAGEWCGLHAPAHGKGKRDWSDFRRRLETIRGLDVLRFEPWVFDGEAMDAEPLFPIASFPGLADGPGTELLHFDRLRRRAIKALAGIEEKDIDKDIKDPVFVVRPGHCQPPVLRGVVRLFVEADTPGRRRAQERRRQLILAHTAECQRLLEDLDVCDTASGLEEQS